MKKFDSILKEVLEEIKPSKEELLEVKASLDKVINKIKENLKKSDISAEIFVGGSFAKGTIIKKEKYDVDIFLRFDKKYEDKEISVLSEKLLKDFEGVKVVHGSRDYFRIDMGESFFIEIIPVKKVKNPKESENITDLSYSHVKYINKKIKSKELLEEIMFSKAFCSANHCYGAESYINGFSGYGLELLTYHYKGFLKLLRALSKPQKDKIIIDLEKDYKNKNEILMNINESKLGSPIVFIDPTFKQRNVLAALSYETFDKFQKECVDFLKTPSIEAFKPKKTDLEKIKKNAEKKKFEFILIEASTSKQEGDVAGSKLLKFYKHLNKEIKKYFKVKDKGFNYNKKKAARFFFVVENKKEILVSGPNIKDEENVKAFKKIHNDYYIKKGRIYSKEKVDFDIKGFIKKWISKNNTRMKEMYIESLEIID